MDKLSVDGSMIAGPARQLTYRIPRYPKDTVRVRLCSLRSETSARDFCLQNGVDVICLGRSKFDVRALIDLYQLVKRWQPSILHLHGYASWTFGRIVARLFGLPVVVQEHFIDESVPAIQRVADWLLRRQQHLGIAVVEAVKDFMVQERYIRDTPIEVIWNGVPIDAVRTEASKADKDKLRRSLNIPANAPVLGIVGRLAESKGHKYFLEAATRISETRPDAHFVVVGTGPLRSQLEQLAATLNLSDRTHFVGHQSNVVPYLTMFDVSVLPSVTEAFLVVVLESLAVGTPAVITDLATYRGLYTEREGVLMVPVCDSAATADAAIKLLADSALVDQLLDNAQRLLTACSLETAVDRYLGVYQKILTRSH